MAAGAAVCSALMVNACAGTDEADREPRKDPDQIVLEEALDFRPLHVEAADAQSSYRIVDDRGREVLLRGANVNSLGDYFAADPQLDPVVALEESDFDEMAANGFNVVRLIVSWSRLQPTSAMAGTGELDEAYVKRIKAAIAAAADRGIATVVDLHQDAWGKFIASTPDLVCPEGKEPAIGWDGAPDWATILTAAPAPSDTCRVKGARELSSAVQAAFSAFYNNTEGLRDGVASMWGALASALGGERGLVGYDLFNEPNMTLPAAAQEEAYTKFVVDSIAAIRAAESTAKHHPSLIFVEPVVLYPLPGTLPTPATITQLRDSGLVFAPHNYAETIGPKILTIEQTMAFVRQGADQLHAALWIGEHGVWDTGADSLEKATRFALSLDNEFAGSAWWQWRQACGDPHSVGVFGGEPGDQVHLNTVSCPDGATAPTEEFLAIARRAFPRYAPGTITELRSDPSSGDFSLAAQRAPRGTLLVVWVPKGDLGYVSPPQTEGLREVRLIGVDGGWIFTAIVDATSYSVELARG